MNYGSVLVGFPFRSLLTTALGNTDDLHSRALAKRNILFAEETAVQATQFGRTPERLLVAVQRGFDLVLVGRISIQHSVLSDQTASTFSQKDFVPEFNVFENLTPVRSQYWVRGIADCLEIVAASYERIPSEQVPMPGRKASLPF